MNRIRTVLTVAEETPERAWGRIAEAPAEVDAVELRVDALVRNEFDLSMFRQATKKPLIFTRRSLSGHSGEFVDAELRNAMEKGFDFVDVEYSARLEARRLSAFRDRVILSYHDFEAVPDLPPLVESMFALGCAHVKIAVTAKTLLENEAILAIVASRNEENLTLFGMGTAGLYSRIVAPALGSEMSFYAASEESIAAPGQLSISRAKAIFGASLHPPLAPVAIFAIAGNPASGSLSPAIHNARFREKSLPALYTILEVPEFGQIAEALGSGRRFAPRGISITAPFKEEAYRFAERECERSPRANESRAVNTIVRLDGKLFADNTDVLAFEKALDGVTPSDAVLLGAGGTARAAAVALRAKKIPTKIVNRTRSKAEFLAREFGFEVVPIESLPLTSADVIINTLSADATAVIPRPPISANTRVVDLSYMSGSSSIAQQARDAGARIFDGLAFLQAQAVPQSDLFIRAVEESRDGKEQSLAGKR